MIYPNFKDFVAKLPPIGRMMGIDWGAVRTGIAISDEARGFAFPREIIVGANENSPANAADRRANFHSPLQRIVEIVNVEKIVGIVVGLPTHADGTDSATTARVREFADELAVATNVPIAFVDERLSSVEAEEIVGAYRIRPNKAKKEGRMRYAPTRIDAAAAAVLLTDAIGMMKK